MALSNRISDSSVIMNANSVNKKTQESYARSRFEADGGSKATAYSSPATAQNTCSILRETQNQIAIEGMKAPMLVVKENLKATYDTVIHLNKIATELASRVSSASDTSTLDQTFKNYCKDKLDEVQSILNQRNSLSAPIFGGSSRLAQVVDTSIMPVPAPGDIADAASSAYFLGESGGLKTTFGENQTISYGCSADEQGIKELIFWLKKGTTVTPDGDVDGNACLALKTMIDGVPLTQKKLALLGAKEGDLYGILGSIEKSNITKQDSISQNLSDLLSAPAAEALIDASESEQKLLLQFNSRVRDLQAKKEYIRNM